MVVTQETADTGIWAKHKLLKNAGGGKGIFMFWVKTQHRSWTIQLSPVMKETE